MTIELVAYEWFLRPMWLQEVAPSHGAQSDFPRVRKFLLVEDNDRLVIIAGPYFTWPMEYHHFLLRERYQSDRGEHFKCLGGGILSADRNQDGEHQVQLAFWRNCVCGQYNHELAGREDDLADVLRCEVTISLD